MTVMAGPGDEDKDAASVRADHPVPFDVSLYYYEVQVVNKGRDGFVGADYLLQMFQASLQVLEASTVCAMATVLRNQLYLCCP